VSRRSFGPGTYSVQVIIVTARTNLLVDTNQKLTLCIRIKPGLKAVDSGELNQRPGRVSMKMKSGYASQLSFKSSQVVGMDIIKCFVSVSGMNPKHAALPVSTDQIN
jgi:hypothetical protein